jgi:branched-chain amino acid transport system ATP-binding protein
MLLEVEDLNVYYGAIHALQGISFSVDQGEIVTLIGANGAGKSTTLRTISGLLRPRRGAVRFRGEDITMTPAEQIVRLGIGQVPEGRRIFAPLTVRENLEMGAFTRKDAAEIAQSMERVFVSFPRLKERINQLGGTLSGGEQQMLATARGLMSRPTLLLLDEPSMGLSPIMVEEIFRIIAEINSQGTSILLVEQNALMALQIAHRAYVLETGRIVLQGTAKELRESSRVREAYLGLPKGALTAQGEAPVSSE